MCCGENGNWRRNSSAICGRHGLIPTRYRSATNAKRENGIFAVQGQKTLGAHTSAAVVALRHGSHISARRV